MRRSREPVLLLGIVSLSGAAGLIYQVAWTRHLITLTSATVTAQAAILAVFMTGLGLGSWLAADRASRWRRPLRAYGLLEVLILASALGSLPLLRLSGGLVPWFTAALPGLPPHWPQLLLCALYLLLPTTLMGMTLPLVIERSERGAPLDGARGRPMLGLLYGVNTLGAVAGALLAGYLAIEHLGLTGTTWLGGVGNLLAALLALGLDFRRPACAAPPKGSAAPAGEASPPLRTLPTARRWVFPLAAALGGAVGLGYEVVWTRLVAAMVPNTVYAFSLVLAAVLLGVALGGGLAAGILRAARAAPDLTGRVLQILGRLQALVAIWLCLAPFVLVLLAADRELLDALARGGTLRGCLMLFALLVPPAALNACVLPLLAAIGGAGQGARSFGRLYAWNTVGSVLGSLLVGLLAISSLGVWPTTGLLALGSLAVGGLLLSRSVAPRRAALLLAGATVLALAAWLLGDFPGQIYRALLPSGMRILELREGVTSDVMVTEEPGGFRKLWINSTWVATTGDRNVLDGNLPALFVERPRRFLGIALGTGQTFDSALHHAPEAFDCVEINDQVIALSRKWFSEFNGGLLDDPRVRVHHADGRAFLRSSPETYDLLVLEPLQAWSAGTTGLYTIEFYQEARRVLKPGGVLVQWLPFYGQGVRETRAMVRAGLEVFPQASLWLDMNDGILIFQAGDLRIDPALLAERIRVRGVSAELARNSVDRLPDLLSLFIAGPRGLARWVEGAPLLEDDHPFLEFAAARTIGQASYLPLLASLRNHLESLADYRASGVPAEAPELEEATRIRDALLDVERRREEPDFAGRVELLERGLRALPDSGRLKDRYRAELLRWFRAEDAAGQGERAEAILRRGLGREPGFAEAAVLLALRLNTRGERAQALELLRAQQSVEPTRPVVERVLRQLGAD